MRTIERSFAGDKESVPQGRAWLGKELELAGTAAGVVDDALLVLSELLTNAVVHSRSSGPHGSVQVRLYFGVSRLRLEVSDAGGTSEPMAQYSKHQYSKHQYSDHQYSDHQYSDHQRNGHHGNGHPRMLSPVLPIEGGSLAESGSLAEDVSPAEGGYGLALVEAFTTRWWMRGDSRGRTFCAELPRHPTTSA